jgi:hypothetical protein
MAFPRSALLCSHHLMQWGGSELVLLELAEALMARDVAVTLFVPFVKQAFVDEAVPPGIAVHSDPQDVSPDAFDMIYGHHQVQTGLLVAHLQVLRDGMDLPPMIYNHLSPYELFELPGPFVEPTLADIVLANSPETMARIDELGALPQTVDLWPNPAPASFEGEAGRGPLRRLLSVSHHLPDELGTAFELLRDEGIEVTRIGQGADIRRVMPDDIAGHDAVVTIGKTVQYALRGRRPVFCYDHFGGPGWLDAGNMTQAAAVNFSGRDMPDTRAPADLADAIRGGFDTAQDFVASLEVQDIAPYALEPRVDDLLQRVAMIPRRNFASQGALDAFCRYLDHEGALYELVDRHYGKFQAERARAAHLAERRDVLRDRVTALQGRIDALLNRDT